MSLSTGSGADSDSQFTKQVGFGLKKVRVRTPLVLAYQSKQHSRQQTGLNYPTKLVTDLKFSLGCPCHKTMDVVFAHK